MPTAFRIAAVGDVCLADSAFCIGLGARSQIDKVGVDDAVKRLSRVLHGADAVFGNLEAVHSDIGRSRFRLWTMEMRGRPEHLDVLSRSSFKVLNVANNHVFQHGLEAYDDSRQQIADRGMAVVGHDEQNASVPAILTKDRVRLIFAGFSLRPEQYRFQEPVPYSIRQNGSDVVAEMRRLRKTEPNATLVCSLHWGHEYVDTPSREQQLLAHELIDSGVSVVLGHHPARTPRHRRIRWGLDRL